MSEIVAKPFESPMVDVMNGASRLEITVHKHGLCALVDVMPRLVPVGKTADAAIVQAARVSYGDGTKQVSEDRGLIRYLVRHRHSTPCEMVEFKFHHVMPIFIARQWIRHRTANVNEYSARYSVVKDRFYRPEVIAVQSKVNKQGRDTEEETAVETAEQFDAYLAKAESLYNDYLALTDEDGKHRIAREMARIGLPLSTYTEWYWKIDLHNLLHFLSLRMHPHAQQEIQDYARAMFDLIQPIVPHACEAFMDYRLNAVTLSALEIAALRDNKPLASDNKREQAEWASKMQLLGISTDKENHDRNH